MAPVCGVGLPDASRVLRAGADMPRRMSALVDVASGVDRLQVLRSDPAARGACGDLVPVSAHRVGQATGSQAQACNSGCRARPRREQTQQGPGAAKEPTTYEDLG